MTAVGTSSRTIVRLRLFSRAAATLTAAAGCLGLALSLLDTDVLRSVATGLQPPNPQTAVTFVLLGVSLWLQRNERGAGLPLLAAKGAALLAVASGSLALASLGLQQAQDGLGLAAMPLTAIGLVLVGSALLILDFEMRSGQRPSQYLTLLTSLVGLLGLGGYVYGGWALDAMPPYATMELPSAVSLVLLPLGVLAARPDRGLMATVISDSAGGTVARRLLPMAVVVPLVTGWLRLLGEQAGLYGLEFGLALFALANVAVFSGVIWGSAAHIALVEQALRASEERYRTVLEHVDEVVYKVSATESTPFSGKVEFVSGRVAGVLGWQPEEFMRDPDLWVASVDVRDLEALRASTERIYRNKRPGTREYRIRHQSSGEYRWIEDRVVPQVNHYGDLVAVVGVARDVTEQKRAEERQTLQALRLRSLRIIDLAVAGSFDSRVTLEITLDQLVNELGLAAASVLLLDPERQMLECSLARGFRSGAAQRWRLPVGEGLAGRVALERRPLQVGNLVPWPDRRGEMLIDEGLTSYYAVPLLARGELKGVLETFDRGSERHNNPGWEEFADSVAARVSSALESTALFADLQRTHAELVSAYDTTLEGWVRAVDLRDRETEGHSRRVVDMTERLARSMGLSDEQTVHIRRGALLHDIGKMGVPDAILQKPGPLADEEWQVMRLHPTYAFEWLSPIAFLRPALDIPYCHHEKWDGTGYPRGLRGEDIPLGARIFAIVDVWDALRSDRPYRPAWSEQEAIEYIGAQAGTHFDPNVVAAFAGLRQGAWR